MERLVGHGLSNSTKKPKQKRTVDADYSSLMAMSPTTHADSFSMLENITSKSSHTLHTAPMSTRALML